MDQLDNIQNTTTTTTTIETTPLPIEENQFEFILNEMPSYEIYLFSNSDLKSISIPLFTLTNDCFLHFMLSTYFYHKKKTLVLPSSLIDDESTKKSLLAVLPFLPINVFESNCFQYKFKFITHIIPYPTMKVEKGKKVSSTSSIPLYVGIVFENEIVSPFKIMKSSTTTTTTTTASLKSNHSTSTTSSSMKTIVKKSPRVKKCFTNLPSNQTRLTQFKLFKK
jgi:hypothetical protein